MLKGLVIKILGRRLRKKLNLQEDAPMTDQAATTGSETTTGGDKPWYQSKTKLGIIFTLTVGVIELGSKLAGHPVTVPPEVFRLLEAAGISVSAWGMRNAVVRK
jgi:hypothetical protein